MNDQALAATAEMRAFGVLGTSAVMQPVLRSIVQAASNGRAVLVCGEAGTGRTAVARSIHALAGCSRETFIEADCSALAGNDLEIDLFGADGLPRRARGVGPAEALSPTSLLWRARQGTVYLANIVDAPSQAQARLARLLRDRQVVGPDGTLTGLDCRFIASAEPGVENAVEDGRFRRDLFVRFGALSIRLPPLRDRREDIPALAELLLEQYAYANGVAPKHLTGSATMLLQALPWHGNLWELRELVESLAQWVPCDSIDLPDVLRSVRLDPQARSVAVGGTLRAARRRFEREYIYAVLQQFGGRIPKAARALGIQRTNLYRKMRSLGLVPAAKRIASATDAVQRGCGRTAARRTAGGRPVTRAAEGD